MKRETVKVEKREILGKKIKKLRREGILPGNVYGRDFKSIAVQLPLKEFNNVFKKVHETGLVDLQLDSQAIPVLIQNVQIDPASRDAIHADFYKVNLKEKIVAPIPIVAVDEAPAVQDKKGLLLQIMSEIEVEALPTDLPEKIEVSIASLNEVNDQITVEALKLPNNVTIASAQPQDIIFKIDELPEEEVEPVAPTEEIPAEGEAAPAEGEQPKAEGEQHQGEPAKEEKA